MEEKKLKMHKRLIKREFNIVLENCKSHDELDYIKDFIDDCKKMLNIYFK